jgi:hypothetical protein
LLIECFMCLSNNFIQNNQTIRVLVNIILFLIITSCSYVAQKDYLYIIPENYNGFLIVRYNCPEGLPLKTINDSYIVLFDENGVFCTSDIMSATTGSVSAQTRSGKSIPVFTTPWGERGYGFAGGSTMTIGGDTARNPGEDLHIHIFWAGDMEYLSSTRNRVEYGRELDLFLQKHFKLREL